MGAIMRFHKLQTLDNLSTEERTKLKEYILKRNDDEDGISCVENGYIGFFDIVHAIRKDEEMLDLIIRAGIDVNMHNGVLMYEAVCSCNVSPVKKLLEAGYDIKLNSFVYFPVMFKTWDVLEVLIENNADVTEDKNLPLREALSEKETKGATMLLQAGAQIQEEWPLQYIKADNPIKMMDMILKDYIKSCDNKFKKKIARIIKIAIRALKN